MVYLGDTRISFPEITQKATHRKEKIEQEEVKRMLNNCRIKPSRSVRLNAIVLVPKKDGSTRFCVKYRKLNDITIKDAYPLPQVDDCLDALANFKWFS